MDNKPTRVSALIVYQGSDVLCDAITACRSLVSGNYTSTIKPSPLPSIPNLEMITVGRTMVAFDADRIHEPLSSKTKEKNPT